LNEWTGGILPLLEDNFFVSAMWRGDLNIARDQFLIYEREKFESVRLIPDCSVGDTSGNITYYARDNNLKFHICSNSADPWGDISLKRFHVLGLPHGEQIFVNGTPFLYHYGRGSARDKSLYNLWVEKTTKYLETTDV
jgi:hypothetical protein